jgi:hypothetical protein
LSMVPLAGASLVAISRTMDNRRKLISCLIHETTLISVDHWQDVLVGSLVGECDIVQMANFSSALTLQ